ncbi:MAG: hypothetical protein Q8L48_08375 [Archangium sp.]|nr:hypothetical protein [Archangium sp.]
MRLERHVGGLSNERKVKYLRESGWREEGRTWRGPAVDAEAFPLSRALHHQLTSDLSEALSQWGWKVAEYSQRGYATMVDPQDESRCSIPAALRRQARRDGCAVRELTYGLFLAAVLKRGP